MPALPVAPVAATFKFRRVNDASAGLGAARLTGSNFIVVASGTRTVKSCGTTFGLPVYDSHAIGKYHTCNTTTSATGSDNKAQAADEYCHGFPAQLEG
jgi:hypothetical protein